MADKVIRRNAPLPWNGGNAPTCPECNSGNAMLSYHGRRDALGAACWDDVQCRDCGLIVLVTPRPTTLPTRPSGSVNPDS